MPYRAVKKLAKDRAKHIPNPRRSLDPKMRTLLEQLDAIPYEPTVRSSAKAVAGSKESFVGSMSARS